MSSKKDCKLARYPTIKGCRIPLAVPSRAFAVKLWHQCLTSLTCLSRPRPRLILVLGSKPHDGLESGHQNQLNALFRVYYSEGVLVPPEAGQTPDPKPCAALLQAVWEDLGRRVRSERSTHYCQAVDGPLAIIFGGEAQAI
ncbi:hypothetical protein BS17DRAFT_538278 [Gyrodon lividus]|nr:hypothetical protein BS17DRAFT_538278 [Gyrodon lividus]